MTELTPQTKRRMHELPSVEPRRAWLCAGLHKSYRVTDGNTDFGEWDDVADAREFLRLLVLGNRDYVEL